MEVLQSRTLVKEVVNNLQLYAPVYEERKINTWLEATNGYRPMELQAGFRKKACARRPALLTPLHPVGD